MRHASCIHLAAHVNCMSLKVILIILIQAYYYVDTITIFFVSEVCQLIFVWYNRGENCGEVTVT